LYHQIGGLMPNQNEEPKFTQIYFYDTNFDNQLQKRKEVFSYLNTEMLKALQNELNIINPFVHLLVNAGQKSRNENIPNMKIAIHNIHGKDMRQYNKPTVSEIAGIIPDDQIPDLRDIVMETHQGKLKHISKLHDAYDPLQYPLLFPYGEFGWTDNILRVNEIESRSESQVGSQTGSTIIMDIDEEERGNIHTGASQIMEELSIRFPSSYNMIESSISYSQSKGKQKEVEFDDKSSESETIFGDEDLELLEI